MKEKERKLIERNRLVEFTKTVNEIKLATEYPKKNIELLLAYHRRIRNPLVEEEFEIIMKENLLFKLENYGENSNFWSRNESFKGYDKGKNANSKRPSTAWLRAKVKCYESETAKQISTR